MKYTWEILARGWTPDLGKRIAHRLKLDRNTVQKWTQPVNSDEFPDSHGKSNIFDHVKFVLREIHKSFPGVARQLVEHLLDFVNFLDQQEGVRMATEDRNPCAALANAVKENADVIVLLSAKPNDPEAWKQARNEISESISSLKKLDGCIEELLRDEK